MSDSTVLVISGEDLPPYSARGLTQSLAHISQAAALRRTINSNLVDVSDPAFRKYASTISGADHDTPALQQLWPGQMVTVDCISRLAYKTLGGAPLRVVVPGSSYVKGEYTFYRPRLTMRVLSHTITEDEWAASVTWSLALEEV